ncbi:GEM-like protein [Mya arenaria]|uniref:GEM-like protein n=1 Tax=Mya arenaria TaxID=6604 RepID=A0ABY7EPF5_MYAAR|nr:GTP-binding protein REM 1-like [Mya arenaria]XP_052815155.1 GTP-binding protein REM 1-like [Mya arenaria]WAR11868.1 GEM-like protein [Mya arenaria]
MTKKAMNADKNERKHSVPKIRHEVSNDVKTDHEERTVADKNQRKIQILASEQGSHSSSILTPTAHHGRSSSFRSRPRPKLLNVDGDRPRRSSLPSPSANLLSVSFGNIPKHKETSDEQPLQRVRSFKTTSKGGIVNRGDSFKRSSNSINSTGSAMYSEHGGARSHNNSRQRINSTQSRDSDTADSTGSSMDTVIHKVAMLGDKGVGITSLTNQFMTSEFVAFETENDDDETDRHVTVLLNSEEKTLNIVDRPINLQEMSSQSFDAFAVVYSITDRASYQAAVDILYLIQHQLAIQDKPTVLIANKIDLVRKRKVTREEGRSVAKQYTCKYCETSAALNHHVDELLVGILSQIRLYKTPGLQMDPPSFDARPSQNKVAKCSMPGPKRLLNFIFRKKTMQPSCHECENLFTL